MRLFRYVVLAAFVTPVSAVAQEPIFGSSPGQVLDSVPIYIGMDFSEAQRLLTTRLELQPEASTTPNHAVFTRRGQPIGAGTVNLVGRDGRVLLLGSDWTPSAESADAFAGRLVELLSLISSPELGGPRSRDCRLSMMGAPEGPFRIAEIACGRHMVHLVRAPTSDGGVRSRLQLLTR
jgi:hypothetical protein